MPPIMTGGIMGASDMMVGITGGVPVTLVLKKKSFLTHMDLYDPYMVPTLFPRGIITFQRVLTKFNFLTKFPHLEKNC